MEDADLLIDGGLPSVVATEAARSPTLASPDWQEGYRAGYAAGAESERPAINAAYSRGLADGRAGVALDGTKAPRFGRRPAAGPTVRLAADAGPAAGSSPANSPAGQGASRDVSPAMGGSAEFATISGGGYEVNRTETSEIFGVTLTTVDNWRRSGCPSYVDGQNIVFNTASVSKWLRDRDAKSLSSDGSSSKAESERRRAAAEAGLVEIRLAQARREVVRVEDVAMVVADDYASLRTRLTAVHGHIEQRIAHLLKPEALATVSALVRDEIAEALEELSDPGSIAGKVGDDDL